MSNGKRMHILCTLSVHKWEELRRVIGSDVDIIYYQCKRCGTHRSEME
jgi:hypothetical protein